MQSPTTRMERLADIVKGQRRELLASLTCVETWTTAEIELDWLTRALTPPDSSISWLNDRRRIGTVYCATPATLPAYSFLLFALAPALAGNHVIVRPATASRHCVELLASLTAQVGFCVEVTTQDWAGFACDARQDADAMVFCGGSEHARHLDETLPDSLRLICQGPGVCAFVVTADADVKAAAQAAVSTRVFNSSQDCLATERVYVDADVHDEFVEAVLSAAQALRVGGNQDPATQLGPLLIPAAADPWLSNLDDHGQVARRGACLGPGLYELSVVLAEADSPVVVEETYCPVLPIVTYTGEPQLREMLGLGRYALGLTVFGSPPRFGMMDYPHTAINSTLYDHEDAWAPFGGHRSTTLLRHGAVRRSGPVLVPFAVSEPA